MNEVGTLATLLKEYGGWGLSAILMVVIWKLYSDNQSLSTGFIERLITALEAAKDAAERVEAALQGMRSTLEARGQTLSDLSHQFEKTSTDIRHVVGNLAATFDAVVSLLTRARQDKSENDRDEPRNRGRS